MFSFGKLGLFRHCSHPSIPPLDTLQANSKDSPPELPAVDDVEVGAGQQDVATDIPTKTDYISEKEKDDGSQFGYDVRPTVHKQR